MPVASASVLASVLASASVSGLARVATLAVAVTADVNLQVRCVSALAPLPVPAPAAIMVAPMLAASAYLLAILVVWWKDDARKAMPLEVLRRSWSHQQHHQHH